MDNRTDYIDDKKNNKIGYLPNNLWYTFGPQKWVKFDSQTLGFYPQKLLYSALLKTFITNNLMKFSSQEKSNNWGTNKCSRPV